MPIIFGGGKIMFLTLIGSNFFINKNYIHNAAMAVVSLRDEGTSLDSNQDVIYNDVDNDKFREVCKDCSSKTTQLEFSDLKALMNCWNWDIFEDSVGHIYDVEFVSNNSIMDEKSEDIILFRILAPYIGDNSYFLFCREDFNKGFGKNNLNFMKWEFTLGRLSVLDCIDMNFGLAPNSEYDCFNYIKTTYLNLNVYNGTYAIKYNSVPTITTTSINQSTIPPLTISFDLDSKTTDKEVKYGGYCKKCGLYDDYAEQNEFGEVHCYQCFR